MSQCQKLLDMLVRVCMCFEMSSIVRTTSTPSQSPEKITISLFGNSYETPVGKDDLYSKDLVY